MIRGQVFVSSSSVHLSSEPWWPWTSWDFWCRDSDYPVLIKENCWGVWSSSFPTFYYPVCAIGIKRELICCSEPIGLWGNGRKHQPFPSSDMFRHAWSFWNNRNLHCWSPESPQDCWVMIWQCTCWKNCTHTEHKGYVEKNKALDAILILRSEIWLSVKSTELQTVVTSKIQSYVIEEREWMWNADSQTFFCCHL